MPIKHMTFSMMVVAAGDAAEHAHETRGRAARWSQASLENAELLDEAERWERVQHAYITAILAERSNQDVAA